MISIEPGLIDANVLVYATIAGSFGHLAAKRLIEAALDPMAVLYVTPQVLCEFYSIVTNRRRVTAPVSSAEAVEAVKAFLALPGIYLLATPAVAVTHFFPELTVVVPGAA